MIGIIITTHGDFGKEIIQSAKMIVGECPYVESCSLKRDSDGNTFNNQLETIVDSFQYLEGIIIFSDLFGGTPSNISMMLNSNKKIRTISGFNMPMIITSIVEREILDLNSLVEEVIHQGQLGIKNTTKLITERRMKKNE